MGKGEVLSAGKRDTYFCEVLHDTLTSGRSRNYFEANKSEKIVRVNEHKKKIMPILRRIRVSVIGSSAFVLCIISLFPFLFIVVWTHVAFKDYT